MKLNIRPDNKTYSVEEKVNIVNGKYSKELKHDNVLKNTIIVNSGSGLSGENITSFTTTINQEKPWQTSINIFTTKYKTVYISYETFGDQVDADDYNYLNTNKANIKHNHLANEVKFEDGDSFQDKLDKGVLKGQKGDKGEQGLTGSPGKDGTDANVTKDKIISELGYTPEDRNSRGIPDGYVPLDAKGRVPLQYIPDIAKQQTYVVENKADMDKLTGLIMGEKCYVTSLGDSYIWNGTAWQVLSKADWENVNLDWENIINKPKSSQTQIDNAVADSHKHANKSVLDKITDTILSNVQKAFDHISDAVKHITSDERKLWNTVGNKAEKTALDSHVSSKNNPHNVTKTQVGLGNVDNTSDLNKPISTATQSALEKKANKINIGDTLNLETDSKVIVGAINEVKNSIPADVDLSPTNKKIDELDKNTLKKGGITCSELRGF